MTPPAHSSSDPRSSKSVIDSPSLSLSPSPSLSPSLSLSLSLSPSLEDNVGGCATGIVFDIQRASLHDGPGLRTTVFLKGCPLRCAWCHNPESQSLLPETGRSGKVYGRTMTVAEVMETLRADQPYYASSGGGLTVSGGEPTVQFDFCRALLEAARAEGIHTCLDTCGHFPPERLDALLPLVDLWHFDYKLSDAQRALRWTGVNGYRIAENLAALTRTDAAIRLRCPIIPGVNDTPKHRAVLETLRRSGRFETVEELPYHDIGIAKYTDLGRKPPYSVSL